MKRPMKRPRPIPDFPGYRATYDGRVQTCKRFTASGWRLTGEWRDLAQAPNRQGYWSVRLTRDGKQYDMQVAHAVLFAFVGPKPKGQVARHLDDDNNNNHGWNLKWGTHKENAADRKANGRGRSPTARPLGQLNRLKVQQAWRLHRAGWTAQQIGDVLGVSRMTVGNVFRGRSWTWVPEDASVALPPGVDPNRPPASGGAAARQLAVSDNRVSEAIAIIAAIAGSDGAKAHTRRCLQVIAAHTRAAIAALRTSQ